MKVAPITDWTNTMLVRKSKSIYSELIMLLKYVFPRLNIEHTDPESIEFRNQFNYVFAASNFGKGPRVNLLIEENCATAKFWHRKFLTWEGANSKGKAVKIEITENECRLTCGSYVETAPRSDRSTLVGNFMVWYINTNLEQSNPWTLGCQEVNNIVWKHSSPDDPRNPPSWETVKETYGTYATESILSSHYSTLPLTLDGYMEYSDLRLGLPREGAYPSIFHPCGHTFPCHESIRENTHCPTCNTFGNSNIHPRLAYMGHTDCNCRCPQGHNENKAGKCRFLYVNWSHNGSWCDLPITHLVGCQYHQEN